MDDREISEIFADQWADKMAEARALIEQMRQTVAILTAQVKLLGGETDEVNRFIVAAGNKVFTDAAAWLKGNK